MQFFLCAWAGEGSGESDSTMIDDEDYITNNGKYNQLAMPLLVSYCYSFGYHAGEEGSGAQWSSGEVDPTMIDNRDSIAQ